MTGLLDDMAETGGTVVISAIDGTAGIGKTALAVSWAHKVADWFPYGQLYVNLRGFDPTGSPMTPADAVCRARPASCPVMRATVACACSRACAPRSRRCAAIERI